MLPALLTMIVPVILSKLLIDKAMWLHNCNVESYN